MIENYSPESDCPTIGCPGPQNIGPPKGPAENKPILRWLSSHSVASRVYLLLVTISA